MGEFCAEGHFADCGLGNSGVLEFAFFVGFKLFDGEGGYGTAIGVFGLLLIGLNGIDSF